MPDERYAYTTQIDGGDVDDAIWGNPTINLGQDAIAEFKVYRNQFDAQYGKATTAVVSVVTKSGTNRMSGSGYYFGRDKSAERDERVRHEPAALQADARRLFVRRADRPEPDALLHGVRRPLLEHGGASSSLPASNPFASLENGTFAKKLRRSNFDGRSITA